MTSIRPTSQLPLLATSLAVGSLAHERCARGLLRQSRDLDLLDPDHRRPPFLWNLATCSLAVNMRAVGTQIVH